MKINLYIPLHGKYGEGKFAIVDDDDFEQLNRFRWLLSKQGYVIRFEKRDNKISQIIMHRQVMQEPDGLFVDHINHNLQDNRKENLRVVTVSQNGMNRQINKTEKTSVYKGVHYSKSSKHPTAKSFISQLKANKKVYKLGFYYTEEMAALVYNRKAKEVFGEYACLNSFSISESEIKNNEEIAHAKHLEEISKSKTSKYKGVYFHSKRKVYIARLFKHKKIIAYAEDTDEDKAYQKLQEQIKGVS